MSDQEAAFGSLPSARPELREALQVLYDAVACSHQPFHWDKTIRAALDGAAAALASSRGPQEDKPDGIRFDEESGSWIAKHTIYSAARTEEEAKLALESAIHLTAEHWPIKSSSSRGPTPDPQEFWAHCVPQNLRDFAESWHFRAEHAGKFLDCAGEACVAFRAALLNFRGSVTRPPEPQGWQPIETAPKDYTGVLLCSADTRTVREGYWSTSSKAWQTLICEGPNDLKWSHWMPLPAPPSSGAAK